MTKMVGFIKFGNGCVKAESVVAIERYMDIMVTTPTAYRVVVHLGNGVALRETFKTEEKMENRYSEVCELVSEGISSAIPLKCDVD